MAFDATATLVGWYSGIADAFRASGVSGDPYEGAEAWPERSGEARYALVGAWHRLDPWPDVGLGLNSRPVRRRPD
jgi:hypothetical protein